MQPFLPLQSNHLYSVFFAPRGNVRMTTLGMQIAQQYLSPFDRLIGVIGEAGSGKSMLVKGMFPGLELCNDDEGVNVRPLPILNIDENSFYSAHTYHLDIRFESAFHQMHILADAIVNAVNLGKRVVVEHFELIYPFIKMNAKLLIGIGEEVIITRPTLFGPLPEDVAKIVTRSVRYRKMAHTAEDLCEYCFPPGLEGTFFHGDVKHGFYLGFDEKPDLDLDQLERSVQNMIDQDIPISFYDDEHILIGDEVHWCTGPRIHVRTTGEIENFRLIKQFYRDPMNGKYLMVAMVGEEWNYKESDINQISF